MSKESKVKMPESDPESIEEKLADDTLENVSGGQIELAGDEPAGPAERRMVTNGITSNGGPWA
jgi:hypothetical protein